MKQVKLANGSTPDIGAVKVYERSQCRRMFLLSCSMVQPVSAVERWSLIPPHSQLRGHSSFLRGVTCNYTFMMQPSPLITTYIAAVMRPWESLSQSSDTASGSDLTIYEMTDELLRMRSFAQSCC